MVPLLLLFLVLLSAPSCLAQSYQCCAVIGPGATPANCSMAPSPACPGISYNRTASRTCLNANDCPSIGACCTSSGCRYERRSTDCQGPGLTWLGPGVDCSACGNGATADTVLGSCCDSATATCLTDVNRSQCFGPSPCPPAASQCSGRAWAYAGSCPSAACGKCEAQGTCINTTASTCPSGFTPFATCPTPNPAALGSCCFADGTCEQTNQTACPPDFFGRPWTRDGLCSVNCGSCELGAVACTNTSQDICASRGSYTPGSPCVYGVCCNMAANQLGCAAEDPATCAANGGNFTAASPYCFGGGQQPCPAPAGTCCHPFLIGTPVPGCDFLNSPAGDLSNPTDCRTAGGSWTWGSNNCSGACPAPTYGACCGGGTVASCTNTTVPDIGQSGPNNELCQGSWLGAGTVCGGGPCAPVTGGCCPRDPGAGATLDTEAACTASGGYWLGANTTAAECDTIQGTCCRTSNTCQLNQTRGLCNSAPGSPIWYAGLTDCSPCPPPVTPTSAASVVASTNPATVTATSPATPTPSVTPTPADSGLSTPAPSNTDTAQPSQGASTVAPPSPGGPGPSPATVPAPAPVPGSTPGTAPAPPASGGASCTTDSDCPSGSCSNSQCTSAAPARSLFF